MSAASETGAEPPEDLTELIRGYNTLTSAEEMQLRLLAYGW
ncbi:hypothetical protein OG863_00400 [Streptomyces decoyicus]|uniref:Uncharacterized protein n=1 Tax=Streptomyces decoyicus TaxID=249567 RepID=A0ABZ1F8P9_9ACTN|nr:hypothetical protein [Streptomyces decoyicus]WSB66576.1 hypothetical protein OG863_00400 [Streptomyces decoyicus]